MSGPTIGSEGLFPAELRLRAESGNVMVAGFLGAARATRQMAAELSALAFEVDKMLRGENCTLAAMGRESDEAFAQQEAALEEERQRQLQQPTPPPSGGTTAIKSMRFAPVASKPKGKAKRTRRAKR